MKRIYRDVQPMTRDDALASLASEDPERDVRALLSLAYFDPDWRWVQGICLDRMRAPVDPQVRAVAATCLGHLARTHKQIDRPEVISALNALLKDTDSSVRGHAQDALDDIEMFVPPPPVTARLCTPRVSQSRIDAWPPHSPPTP